MRLLDDMTKKVYSPAEGVSLDADSAFSVLLDDIIEISRKIISKLTLSNQH